MLAERLNSGNEGENQRNKFSRREFFKKAIKVAAAGGAVGLTGFAVGNEIVKGKDGVVQTREGTYYPIYEAHNIEISLEDIPQNIDALFTEGGVPEGMRDDIAKRGDTPSIWRCARWGFTIYYRS